EVVDWGLERGFYVTLNGHHEDWLKNNYTNPVFRARYDSIWVQIAERFRDKSDKLLFEIINEPKGMTVAQVDDLNARILGIIRETNPTRIVIYGGNEWANAEQLLTAAIPDDDYLIGYYHAYDPWPFSGEGNGTWGTAFDYQQLNNKYQSVKNWSVANNIPIHHSEFGAIHACDFNSRMRIYAHNVERCIVHGFAFSVWDDGGDFGILNRANNTWPEVKDILLHYHEDSPHQITSASIAAPGTNEPATRIEWNNRSTAGNPIVVERAVGVGTPFVQVVELPADATTFLDLTVTTGQTYTYRMYTTRADGTLLHGYPTRVRVAATQQTPFNATPLQIPGQIEMEEYDNGGEGLAYHDNDPNNQAAGFRLGEGVDIGALGNGYLLEYVESGEWIEYTVNVAEAGLYEVTANVASEQANGLFSINFENNNANTNFTVPNTGGWYVFQQEDANNQLELSAGEQVFRLSIINNIPFNVDQLVFSLVSTSTEDVLTADQFSVSPNPTQGELTLRIDRALVSDASTLTLTHPTGQVIRQFSVTDVSTTLQLDDLAAGVYLLRLETEDGSALRRIIVQ
ncbi:MAG: cellulase family glycosylhydrolase, partial [Bacteroidota bacterium]